MYKSNNFDKFELLEFDKPVSLAHYGTSKKSLDYIELEKLEASRNGYKKFMIKAKAPGTGELTFQSGTDFIKIRVYVEQDYTALENELNKLFGIKNASYEQKIKVVSANLVSDIDVNGTASVYLRGEVENAKDALLATSFAANAVGDHGVKIFSNPGGQLRSKDLDSKTQTGTNFNNSNTNAGGQSFVQNYEDINKLVDTNNLYRDVILSSENEKVISYLSIKEPKRYAVKVRFLEMDSEYVDDFVAGLNTSSVDDRLSGVAGELGNSQSILDTSLSGFGSIPGGNLVDGTVKLFDSTFLNLSINDLLTEGILRVVNEFSLVTHSGEMVALGKGTRFPIPSVNNSVGNSSISVEYIPIGFKGELKVTDHEDSLIDVQLASRLSTPQSFTNYRIGDSVAGVPIFKEEYVNSGAILADGQEVVLNAFMTEIENLEKRTSPLGRIIPFLGSSKQKRKEKSLLFIAIIASEMVPSSELAQLQEIDSGNFELPHINLRQRRNIFSTNNSKLRSKNIKNTINIAEINTDKKVSKKLNPSTGVDPLSLDTSIDEDF